MKKAFSLIEVLLIIALVAITFAGIMALTQRILQLENVVRNDFIAEGLLREGAELVTAVRNENASSSLAFFQDIWVAPTPPQTAYLFALDWQGVNYTGGFRDTANHVPAVTGASDVKAKTKYKASAPSFLNYQLTQGDATVFSRYFKSTYKTDNGGRAYLDVEVIVYWEERGKGHSSNLHTKLYAR